jgi:acetyl/propionyl-CoA carboxylase alpha subunit
VKKGVLLVAAVVVGTLSLTYLVWRQTWFGARLDDDELVAAMAPTAKARDVQHGIEEITRRFGARAVGMERWAKALVEASRRTEDPVRVQAAWAMQTDAGREEFVARLREMVAGDSSVLVRRNAACSLAASHDATGRAVLRSMLEPFTVTAPEAGVVDELPGVDTPVRENRSVGRVRKDDGTFVLVMAAVPGRVTKRAVESGAHVAAGDAVLVLEPDAQHAENAALALSLVGTKEDLALLDSAAAPQSTFPDAVKAAARAAADAVRARGK